ncbi:polymer-forming cytoskeletal protein [Desulfitobacterium sp. Sab5]|uniref:bactofilin family protein n=1 Tax=Desulfitobacterium nosdiversum TaxID=3375356 RepID=UPI003CE7D350
MWGKDTSTPFQAGAPEMTYIAAECDFSGKIMIKGNARIDGQFDGTVEVTGDLVVGPSAVVKANILAATVNIAGEVRGDITAKEKLELSSSARLYGDICTHQLKIDQGAKFVGTSRLMEESESS